MFIGSKPKDIFPRQNKASADFFRRQQQKKIRAATAQIERYFRRNEGGTDYISIPAVTLNGAFRVSLMMTNNGISNYRPVGDSNGFDNELRVDNDGLVVSFKIAGGVFRTFTLDTPLVPSDLTSFDFVRDSSDVTSIEVNGVVQSTTSVNAGGFYIDQICKAAASSYHVGIISDLRIDDSGTPIRNYPINDNDNTIRDLVSGQDGSVINGNIADWSSLSKQVSGDWFGVELITQQVWENPEVSEAQWSFSNNIWTLIGDGSISQLEFIRAVNQPASMVLSGECLTVSGHLAVTSNNAGQTGITSTGLYSFDLDKSEIVGQLFKRHTGIVSATISKPSLREVLRIA